MIGGPLFYEWLQGWKTLRRMQDVDKDAGAPPIEKAEEGAPIGSRPKELAAPSSSLAPPTGSAPRRRRPGMKLTSSGFGEEEKQVVGSAASRSDMHPSRKRPLMTEEQLDYFGQSYKYEREVRGLTGQVPRLSKARRTRPWLSEGAGGAHPTPQPPTEAPPSLKRTPSHVLLNVVLQLQRVQQALLRDTGLHDAELVQEEPRIRNSSR